MDWCWRRKVPSFGGGSMNKRYIVDLTADERANLLALLGKGVAPARKLPHFAIGRRGRDRRRDRRCSARASGHGRAHKAALRRRRAGAGAERAAASGRTAQA